MEGKKSFKNPMNTLCLCSPIGLMKCFALPRCLGTLEIRMSRNKRSHSSDGEKLHKQRRISGNEKDGGKRDLLEKLWETNMLESVLRRLSCEEVYTVAGVCKKWRRYISKPLIRSLYLPAPRISTTAFMLSLSYTEPYEDFHPLELLCQRELPVIVDTQGQCHNFPSGRFMGVTANGLVVQRALDFGMLVSNPSSKRRKIFRCPQWYVRPPFAGVSFNPTTTEFKYVEGTYESNVDDMKMQVFDSSSQDNKWKEIHYPYSSHGTGPLWRGHAVTSWDCFFWIGYYPQKLVVLGLKELQFRIIELPRKTKELPNSRWCVKGGEGNVVVVCSSHFEPYEGWGWKLLWHGTGMGCDYEWVPLHFDLGTTILHNRLCTFCEQKWRIFMGEEAQMSPCGYWLISHVCQDRDMELDLFILDENGKLVHSVSMYQLLSKLPPVYRMGTLRLDRAWPLQLNNLFWPGA